MFYSLSNAKIITIMNPKKSSTRNYAFIDGNNLYLGAKNQKIRLDYGKFRKYLRSKYSVEKAFLFIGYSQENTELYSELQNSGFILVFKPTIPYVDERGHKTMKGNVDAELVLHASAIEYANYNQAVVVTGDGDFACLMKYLEKNNKLCKIIVPTVKYSKLLRPYNGYILPLAVISKQISSK